MIVKRRPGTAATACGYGSPVSDSPAYLLRPAEHDDIDAVLAFWRDHAEDTDRQDDRRAVEQLLARDPAALLLAVEGRDIVGSVIAGWDGWRCHLYRIAVRADRRQIGVARALLALAEDRFAACGARRVDAMVLVDNALGQLAWTALGYQPQEQWRRWVKALPDPP
jgi:ribosomal protein S18 acetylase RimI-like enzyme